MPRFPRLLDDARALHDRTVELRRTIHRRPEIGLDLPHTRRAVLAEIADLGLAQRLSERTSAVVAVLDGARPGPTVILRGDMDALPLHEDTGLPFASEVDGAMHACGHDTHVAMLAGAARLLSARRAELGGRVVFFFQPGEETHGGARIALEEGLLDDVGDVVGAFALHITTAERSGVVALRPGAQLAATDTFFVTVEGRGGHASAPALANDPIPVACEMVTALQTVMTRRVKAFDPAIVTVAHLTAGTTTNVIPSTAVFEGTVRTLSEEVRVAVREHIHRVTAGVAAAHDMTVDVRIEPGYPVTVNDADFAERVHTVAGDLLGADGVRRMENPIMGAEDFSYLLQRHPGAMAFLGGCLPSEDPASTAWNHSNLVVFDEDALSVGVATHAAVTLDLLGD
ncbi:MAG: amidohydrolase [Streptosporangiales bacterium]|nr:amidohydrolase [Streptosporangiales bacterium]